jgi:hypothetical protein
MLSRTRIDERTIAWATNDARELSIYRLLKGEAIDSGALNTIPCGAAAITNLIKNMSLRYPQLSSTIKQVGGMNSKDYIFEHNNMPQNIELKTANKKLSKAALTKLQQTPWIFSCEFLQGQLKNKEFQTFLGPYKESIIIKQYFEKVIQPFMDKYKIEGPIDWENYVKVIYTLGSEQRTKMLADTRIALGARNLIKFLQEDKAAQTYIVTAWKTFCNTFMEAHRPDDTEFEAMVKKRLAQKHIWIVITTGYAQEIEGPQCISLTFDKVKSGTTTSVLQYILELKKPSEENSYKVAMEFRIHWKNMGQGVGNPNFMLK